MNDRHTLAVLDMIDGTGHRIDLLTARVQALECVVLILAVACAGLLVTCWFQLAALYCLARATIGPPPWRKPKAADKPTRPADLFGTLPPEPARNVTNRGP